MSKETKKDEQKVINLNVKYGRTKEEEGVDKTSDAELTVDYITFAINSAHEKGLEGQLKRIAGRLLRKLDDSVLSGKYKVPLESAEVDLIKKSFEKASVPARIVKFFIILEDEIEKL